MGYTLLTGATGLLGSFVLRDLMALDRPVAVLVRPSRQRSARERIEDVLVPFERTLGRRLPRPVVLAGDIVSEHCGLNAAARTWLRTHCQAVLHSAASLAFVEDQGEPRLSNVQGTLRVLEVCRECGVRELAHVSTAYVCGLSKGVFFEHQLDHGRGYGNVYEETKAEAERLVRAAEFLDRVTVFRPSIITGDSQTGYTTTFHGFYTPLRVLQALKSLISTEQVFGASYLSALGMQGDERKNFVSVEWVSDAIVKLLARQTKSGQTYALTSATPVTVDELRLAFGQAIAEHLATSTQGGFARGGSLSMEAFESQFREQSRVYESYWRDDCDFDRSNSRELLADTPCPAMDRDTIVRLSRFALASNFGFPKAPSPPCDFWVEDWLGGVGQSDDDAERSGTATLVATGPGGGRWSLSWTSDQTLRWSRGGSARSPSLRLPSSKLASLAARRETLPRLLDDGVAVGDWPTPDVTRLARCFSAGPQALPGAAQLARD